MKCVDQTILCVELSCHWKSEIQFALKMTVRVNRIENIGNVVKWSQKMVIGYNKTNERSGYEKLHTKCDSKCC